MPVTPPVVDLTASNFSTQTWVQSTCENYESVNGVPVALGDLPESSIAQKPTAEWANAVNACLRQVSAVFRGTSMPTALQISEYFRLPRYTTAQLTNALAVSQGEGAIAYDTTLDRIKTSNGATWQTYLASGDVQPGIHVFGNGGGVDGDFDTLDFHEQDFDLTDNADGSVSIALGQLQLSNLPAGVDRTLFTYATVAGPVNTTTATDILSQSISGNTLSADGQALEVDLAGELHNQSGSNQTWEIAVLLGGVEIYRDTSGAFASSTAVKPWRLTFRMTRVSSTTLHFAGFWNVQVNAVQPDTGLGDLSVSSTTTNPLGSAVTSPTVAWGSSQTLQVRITCSSATNTDFQRRSGFVKRCAA